MNKQRLVILIIAAVGFISVFLPWVSMPIVGSISGASGWNLLVLLFFAVPIVLSLMGDRNQPLGSNDIYASVGSGAISAIWAIIFIIRMRSALSGGGEDNPFAEALSSAVSVGFGVILTIIAGAALAVVPFVLKDKK